MTSTESAGRPRLPRTEAAQPVKSQKSAASGQASHPPHQSKPKTSTEQPPKPQPGSPKSPKASTEKPKVLKEEPKPPAVAESKPATSAPPTQDVPIIVRNIFAQILELDDDDTRDFSRSMVNDYYSQVDATLVEMDKALEEKDLKVLSDLGHFLKGSSAALGVERVQVSCERIQHAGKLRDEVLGTRLTEPQALDLITELLEKVKCDYPEAREELDRFFETQ